MLFGNLLIIKNMPMNLVEMTYRYFKKYAEEAPNPTLIKDIEQQVRHTGRNRDEDDIFVNIVGTLRHDFGYPHPIEEQADQNDARPFLANLQR